MEIAIFGPFGHEGAEESSVLAATSMLQSGCELPH